MHLHVSRFTVSISRLKCKCLEGCQKVVTHNLSCQATMLEACSHLYFLINESLINESYWEMRLVAPCSSVKSVWHQKKNKNKFMCRH